jgi:hypothetical protein
MTAGPRTRSGSNLGRVRGATPAVRKAAARKAAAAPSSRAASPAASAAMVVSRSGRSGIPDLPRNLILFHFVSLSLIV